MGDTLAVLQRGAVEHVTGHVHLLRVEAERLDDGAVDGAVVGLRMGQRQTDVLVKRETAHLRHVDVLGLHHGGEVTVGGQRARTGRQTQHRVRLALDQIRDAAGVQLAGLILILHDNHFRHVQPPCVVHSPAVRPPRCHQRPAVPSRDSCVSRDMRIRYLLMILTNVYIRIFGDTTDIEHERP